MLLATVRSGARHGYAICEEIRRRSGGELDVPEGTVYPALHRLEASGLLESHWADESRRRRRLYRLTKRGRAALGEHAEQWYRFQHAVSAVIGGLA